MNNILLEKISTDIKVQGSMIADKIGRNPCFKMVESSSKSSIIIDGEERLNFGSNNYLGLTTDESTIKFSIDTLKKYGTGFTGSRLLNGTSLLHQDLENALAEFYNFESALIFPTGYTANRGLLSGLLSRNYTVFIDEEIHASIWDGLLLSRCKVKKFRHNDSLHFEQLLTENSDNVVMCIIEGVYSMNGDIAPVDEFSKICKKNNILLFVDEAHGFGVLGNKGAGASEYCGVLNQVDIISITFSKSLGSCGGAILGKRELIDFIKWNSRPFLFTASNTPASLASVLRSLEILDQNPDMPKELLKKAEYFRNGLKTIGLKTSEFATPIIPVEIGDDFRVLQAWKMLWNRGVFCNPVVSPAVAKGKGVLRFSVMRTHEYREIDQVIEICNSSIKPILNM